MGRRLRVAGGSREELFISLLAWQMRGTRRRPEAISLIPDKCNPQTFGRVPKSGHRTNHRGCPKTSRLTPGCRSRCSHDFPRLKKCSVLGFN